MYAHPEHTQWPSFAAENGMDYIINHYHGVLTCTEIKDYQTICSITTAKFEVNYSLQLKDEIILLKPPTLAHYAANRQAACASFR